MAALRAWKARQSEERLAAGPTYTDDGLVFSDVIGVALRPRSVSRWFTNSADLADLPRIGVHGLRHTYATAALRAGVPVKVVSTRLGHADIATTLSIYAHVLMGDDHEAAERAASALFL